MTHPEPSSAALLELARPLGLDESTLGLLRILPVVYVAWADGEVQSEELDIIRASADKLGVTDEASLEVLEGWIGERPDKSFFDQGLKVLSYLVASLPDEEAATAVADVASLSDSVARAAGGLSSHVVRIEPGEQLALSHIALRLKLGSTDRGREVLRSILNASRSIG